MPFLTQDFLREAVQRLGASRAAPRLADFLIFKRAAVRTATPDTPSNGALGVVSDPTPNSSEPTKTTSLHVVTGTKSAAFVDAIKEMALAVPQQDLKEWNHQPFFLPFGALRDKAHGYKSSKYPSNGPDNTVAGWQTQSFKPVLLVPGTSPREWIVGTGTEEQLSNFLLVRSGGDNFSDSKPRLLDVAAWWHRFTEFATPPTEVELIAAFIEASDLSNAEQQAVFEPLSTVEQNTLSFAPNRAAPSGYLPAGPSPPGKMANSASTATADSESPGPTDVQRVIDYVEAQGYIFEPWQIAAYITAVRTKPFVILAGVSGTGKTKLPRLVADAAGARISVVPVQANWNDSSDLIGFERLTGEYAPGHLLRLASEASSTPEAEHFLLLDEMNIARPEYYLAEVLSLIEERRRNADSTFSSSPLAPTASADWNTVSLPSNLCLVGSVNMDETTFGFSRKVLDRSFVIEFSEIDLTAVGSTTSASSPTTWPISWWRQTALTLAEHPNRTSTVVADVIEALRVINDTLTPAQLQVGYRVRDEVALFCLHAQAYAEMFTTRDASPVDPLDLAITMKVLPRIQGGGPTVRAVLTDLLSWSNGGTDASGNPTASTGTAFPMCADRISLMLKRFDETGFTSFWL